MKPAIAQNFTQDTNETKSLIYFTLETQNWDFCQTLGLVLRLRVDFVFPLIKEEQEEQEQEQQPTPKSISGGWTRRLKFYA